MDEEAVKPCIQDRLRKYARRVHDLYGPYNINLIFIVLLIIQVVITIVLFFIEPFSLLEFNQKIAIFFSWAIFPFTVIGAISTWLQYAVTEKSNKIEDIRNELENVYGPLYTILYPYIDEEDMTGEFNIDLINSQIINEKFSTYPHVFSDKLYNYWKIKIQSVYSSSWPDERIYASFYFAKIFCDEYEEKVKSYRKLLGKE